MPSVVARLGIKRHHRVGKKLITRALTAKGGVKGGRTAGADDELIRLFIIDHCIPDTAAAFCVLVPTLSPGGHGATVELILRRLVRITRYGIKAPYMFSRFGIKRIHMAATGACVAT